MDSFSMTQVSQMTLWTLAMSGSAVMCEARTHPLGVELRYVLDDRLLMSRVFDSWDRLSAQARNWRDGLETRGWIAQTQAFLFPTDDATGTAAGSR